MGGKEEEREGEGKEGERDRGLTPTFLYPPTPLNAITNRENFHCKVSNRLSTTSAVCY